MKVTRRCATRIGLGAVALIAVIVVAVSAGPREPMYRGEGLLKWLDGTMVKKGIPKVEMIDLLESVGPEAIPWLIELLEKRDTPLDRRYLRLYRKLGASRRWFPEPRILRMQTARFNAARTLSRLAPGTKFENRVAKDLVSFDCQGDRHTTRVLFHFLGSFTNSSEIAVPFLLTGVTNPVTFESSVGALQRFGTVAVPSLYRMAQAEADFHIRPAQLALQKIDTTAFQRFLDEKEKSTSR